MAENSNGQNTETENLSLKDLILGISAELRYLKAKIKTIFYVTILGSVLGLTYAYFTKPIYKAELSFALEDEKASGSGIGTALGLASQFGIDLGGSTGGGAFSGDNLLALMRSRTMVEKTLLTTVNIKGKKQTLAELYISFNNLREKWEDKPELKNVNFSNVKDHSKFTLQQDSLLGIFYKSLVKDNLIVDKVDKKLSIISIRVSSKNEIFSKFFTDILVKNVSDFYVSTKTKKSVQNVGILQRQTDSVRHELNLAINGVATSVDVNPNPNPALQILRAPSQRRQIDVQANTAILTELVKNLEISKISLRKETPLIQIIDYPIFPLEKERFGKVKGIVLGGILGCFLSILLLTLISKYKKLINDK